MAESKIKPIAFISAVLLCMLFSGGAWAMSGQRPVKTAPGDPTEGIRNSREKILAVLESKTRDGKVIEKAADKLRSVNKRELRLMASLCDRIAADNGTAGADIAFSLVSALIVLS